MCRLTEESHIYTLDDLPLGDAARIVEFVQVRTWKNIPKLLLHFCGGEERSVCPHFITEVGMICQIIKVYISNLRDNRLHKEFIDLEQKIINHSRDEFNATLREIFLKKGLIKPNVEDATLLICQIFQSLEEFKENPKIKNFLESGIESLFDNELEQD